MNAYASDEVIRAFVAVEIGDEVRDALSGFQRNLKKAGARVGWVDPANIHLTLVFLGNIFGAQVETLSVELDNAAAGIRPFACQVAGAGWFGSRSPRVIWVGVEDPERRLAELQTATAEAAMLLDFPLEKRDFKPHLTLGRVRSSAGVQCLTSALSSAKNTRYGSMEVRRLLLMQSHLGRQGVRYSVLHESALKGAE